MYAPYVLIPSTPSIILAASLGSATSSTSVLTTTSDSVGSVSIVPAIAAPDSSLIFLFAPPSATSSFWRLRFLDFTCCAINKFACAVVLNVFCSANMGFAQSADWPVWVSAIWCSTLKCHKYFEQPAKPHWMTFGNVLDFRRGAKVLQHFALSFPPTLAILHFSATLPHHPQYFYLLEAFSYSSSTLISYLQWHCIYLIMCCPMIQKTLAKLARDTMASQSQWGAE